MEKLCKSILLSASLAVMSTVQLPAQLSFRPEYADPYAFSLLTSRQIIEGSFIISCPPDVTLECGQSTSPDMTGTPVAAGTGSYTTDYSDVVNGNGCNTIILRNWIVTSFNGTQQECVQQITLVDNTAPTIAAFPSIWYNCNLLQSGGVVAADNCDSDVSVDIQVTDSIWISPSPCQPGMFRTQTQGGWGTNPNGNNPGVYLNANFNAAFPTGLTIGCNNKLRLTTAQAVRDFLPSGSSPSPLPAGTLVNPGGTYNNVFAGQVVALTLSTTFDAYDPNFGSSSISLGELQIAGGAFAGYTVSQILQLANEVIGGCNSSYSPSSISSVIASINENFVDGTQNNHFLNCAVPFDCYLQLGLQITATDDCNNQTQLNQTVIVVDEQAPVISGIPATLNIECGQIPTDNPIITDGCFTDLLNVVYSETQNPVGCGAGIIRTWTATDYCGNSTTFTQNIIVNDHVPPVFISSPPNLELFCGQAIPEYIPVATDNCDQQVDITYHEEFIQQQCSHEIIRTWTATDDCGNSTSVSQTITRIDQLAPEAIDFVPEITISCSDDSHLYEVQFTDDCGSVADVQIHDLHICPGCQAFIIRTYEASDWCGNVTILEQIIHLTDNQSPVFSNIPVDVNLPCGAAIPLDVPVVSDNCSSVTVNYSEEDQIVTSACRQLIRRWTATDQCGNSATAEQRITWVDDIAPQLLNVPMNITVSCGDVPAPALVTAIDNCDVAIVVQFTETATTSGCNQSIQRVWSAVDACGNMSMAIQIITLSDLVPPVFLASQEVSIPCGSLASHMVIAVDQCNGGVSISFTDQTFGSGCSADVLRTWTATDGCGNAQSFTQLIHLIDNVPPVFVSVPPGFSLPCSAPLFYEEPVVTDNCGSVSLVYSEVQSGSGCNYTITRTWTATDLCGNASTAQQVITFSDNVAPTIQNVPANISLSCDNAVIPPPSSNVTAIDNCGSAPVLTFSEQVIPGSCPQAYEIKRTWTATDNCGNQTVKHQIISIYDNTAPQFSTLPQDVFASCGNIPSAPVLTATDNCSAAVNIQFSENNVTGGCPVLQRVWTATDACGNSTSVFQFVQFTDDEAPVVILPELPNTAFTCTTIPPVQQPNVSDNCDNQVDLNYVESVVGTGCEFTMTRTWIATDDCGNTAVVSQSFLVNDVAPPVFINPIPEITIQCNQLAGLAPPAATDDCGQNVLFSFTDQILGSGCNYDIIRTHVAMDLCGNSASFVQLIHVVDTTAPLFNSVPLNTFVSCNNIPSVPNVVANDACSGPAQVIFNQLQMGGGCNYQIIRTWTATDNCGNTSVATQVIYVQDQQAPVFQGLQANIGLSCTDAIPAVAHPVVTDNCTPAANITVLFDELMQTTSCTSTITRMWVAIDACGNSSSFIQNIVLSDTQAPVFNQFISDIYTTCDLIPAIPNITASDNCSSSVSVSYAELMITGSCPYVLQRTWTATDQCGNSSTLVQKIFITDTEPPVLAGVPNNLIISCEDAIPTTQVIATDNCTTNIGVIFTEQFVENGCTDYLIRTWTATDHCGNQTTASQTITIQDVSGPQYPFTSANLVVECSEVPVAQNTSPTDCNLFTENFYECILPGSCSNEYSVIRYWGATDQCGNATLVVQTIAVVDTTAPELSDLPRDISMECGEQLYPESITAHDNCSGEVEVLFSEYTVGQQGNECTDGMQTIRTWTATDCAGNTATHTQVITWLQITPSFGFSIFDVTQSTPGELRLTYKMVESGRLTIDLFDFYGNKIATVFTGDAIQDVQYNLSYPSDALAHGGYLFRLIQNDTELVEKQIIVR